MNTMQTEPSKTPKNNAPVYILLAVLIAAVGWVWYRVETMPEPKTPAVQQTTPKDQQEADGTWDTTVTSGKGAFSLTLPDGWGPLLNDKNSDAVIMPGRQQPGMAPGSAIKITEIEGHGSDSPSLFIAILSDIDFAPPRGEAAEFTIGKGEEALTGKKYTYIYESDSIEGIGYTRFAGDRDYQYVFTTKSGKKLHVFYHVYGADPRNLSDTVDEIVRLMQVK